MPAARYSVGARTWVVGLFGLASSAAFLALAVRGLDRARVGAALARAEIWPWLPLAVTSYLVGHVLRGVRCRWLFGPETPLSFATASNIVVVGYAANNLLPARLGEFVRAAMLAERAGVPYSQALTVTFVERLLDGIAILLWLAFAARFLRVEGWVLGTMELASLVLGLAALGTWVAVFAPHLLLSLAARVARGRPSLGDGLVRLVTRVTNAASYLRQPEVAARAFALSALVWWCEAGLFAFVFRALGLSVPGVTSLFSMSVTNLAILVPSTPGFVGTFELACKTALTSQGVEPAFALSAALLVHVGFYVPVTLWGVGALFWYGVEVGTTLAVARGARFAGDEGEVEGVPVFRLARIERPLRGARAGKLELCLVEALVDGTRLEPHAERARVAAQFVVDQLAALPLAQRGLVRLAWAAFQLLVGLRYLRPFASLAAERRRAVVMWWAFGPLPPARAFFRVLRSLSLLGYYDAAPEDGRARETTQGGVP